MKKNILIIILVFLNIIMAFVCFLGYIKSREAEIHTPEIVIKKLSLTNEQIKKYTTLLKNHTNTIEPLLRQLKKEKQDYFISIINPHGSSPTSFVAINRTQNHIDSLLAVHLKDLQIICNPQQKIALNDLVKEFLSKTPK
jgi:Flp pilus assembly protein TadB